MTRGFQAIAIIVLLTAPVVAAQAPSDRGQPARAPGALTPVERALLLAVNSGAQTVIQQVRQVAPQPQFMLAGAPDVTGFRLTGYGVFFHVRVPAIRPTFALALRLMDPRDRPSQVSRGRGTRVAIANGAPETAVLEPPPPDPFVDPDLIRDPNAVYTREVKAQLIEAMLESSRGLALAPDEVFTVAARDPTPLDLLDPLDHEVQTIEFKITGRDLAAYHSGAISVDEARKRVAVTEQ